MLRDRKTIPSKREGKNRPNSRHKIEISGKKHTRFKTQGRDKWEKNVDLNGIFKQSMIKFSFMR